MQRHFLSGFLDTVTLFKVPSIGLMNLSCNIILANQGTWLLNPIQPWRFHQTEPLLPDDVCDLKLGYFALPSKSLTNACPKFKKDRWKTSWIAFFSATHAQLSKQEYVFHRQNERSSYQSFYTFLLLWLASDLTATVYSRNAWLACIDCSCVG